MAIAAIAVLVLVAAGSPADDIQEFGIYSWSSSGTPDVETLENCRAIDQAKKEVGWAAPRREVADVSDLELPDDQERGSVYRVFVDYCVRLDGSRERPVGSMTFRVARHEDLAKVKRWGSRHYKATAKVRRRVSKPVREHFDPPDFDR